METHDRAGTFKAISPITPSPGTPGEGRGEGLQFEISNLKFETTDCPHPNPPPEYRERE
jgi:hypothetical protein